MRTIVILLASAALAACAARTDGPVPADADGEAVLAEALAGRTAGSPVSCVRQRDVRNTRGGGGGNTILFDGTGDTVYVNQASGSCPRILPWHAISHRSISTNICTGENVRIFDPQTGIEFGSCSLGEFVPWRRAR